MGSCQPCRALPSPKHISAAHHSSSCSSREMTSSLGSQHPAQVETHECMFVFKDPPHPSVHCTFLPPGPTWLQAPEATVVVKALMSGPTGTPTLALGGRVTQPQPIRALLLPLLAGNNDQCGGDLAATQDNPWAFHGCPGHRSCLFCRPQTQKRHLAALFSPPEVPSVNEGRKRWHCQDLALDPEGGGMK